jgi:alginate O-acetyltransferase complex protein AlgI
MTFTSWPFVAFVAVTFALYYLPVLRRWQVQMLVLASLCFYGTLQPEMLALLVVAVLGTYFFLRVAMDRRHVGLAAGIAFNLGLLAFFKYKFLFIDTGTPSAENLGAADWLLKLPLPIGISFFVLHNISLLIDLAKRGGAARRQRTSCFTSCSFRSWSRVRSRRPKTSCRKSSPNTLAMSPSWKLRNGWSADISSSCSWPTTSIK